MAEINTDSYIKPPALPAQKSLLDQVGQYQQLESNSLTISKQKLDQVNQQFGLMNQELSGLADGNPTKEEAEKRLTTFAKTYGFKPEVTNHMLNELHASPDVKSFAEKALIRGQTTQEKLNQIYGNQNYVGNGQTNTPVMQSQMRGIRPNGAPIQQQIPPTAEVRDTDNRPVLQGPTPAIAAPGTVTSPGQLPVRQVPTQAIPSYVSPPRSNTGTTINSTHNSVVQNRFPAPSGPVVGSSPLFEEGKKAYTEDQALATKNLTDIKPALAALDLMKGLRSGPGTETWNKAVAFAKANNIIPTDTKNDPTAIYQEVNKYLNQTIQGSGTRSDADLAQKEVSSPNVGTQINPALEKLTRNLIAQKRIEAARAGAWEGGNKLEEYGKHRSTFPSKMDPRAFSIDKLDVDERQKLLSDMLKSKNTKEGQRFWQSLEAAKRSGVLGIN